MKFKPRIRHALISLLIGVVLVLVFLAYLQPAFILDLANRYVLC
jgi:hypothetical protein